jgi:AcrR family transcriptional regulator
MPDKSTRGRATRTAVSRPGTRRGGAPAQERELRSQGRQTMRRLLDAGRTVFERRGFHAARVDDIVSAARTSHGTFYLYFSNKEDLFKALAYDTLHEMAVLVDSLGPVTADDAGRAELRRWVDSFCEIYAAHGTVIRAWTEGQVLDVALAREGGSMLLQLASTLATRIEEHPTSGIDPKAAGVACLAMLERFSYFEQAHQVSVDRDAMVDTLTTAAYAGFFSGAGRG